MTTAGRHLAALGVGAVLLMSSGCGSSGDSKGDPLPAAAVAAISGRLTEVQRRYASATNNDNPGACRDIERDSYKAISASVKDLPASVDADVRKALEESLARLQELTRTGCSQIQAPPAQDTTPQETTPPPTVPQETTPQHTDTQTVPDEKKPKKDKAKGNGKGNGTGDGGTVTQPGGTVTQPGSSGGAQPVPPGEG